ncbi:MAG TPA: glycoside hydrolase domain-containing protein [Candidatus Acidoferrum sp.]|nr:glycoside hydrolase domain-containing protein [Candidatus Acidoferrum sp.]
MTVLNPKSAPTKLCSLLLIAVAMLFVFAAKGSVLPMPDGAEKSYLGFDRNDYPGDDGMKLLRKDFAFASYWLSAPPGEKNNTWSGKREFLRSLDFGFVVLYRGPDSSELKNEAAAKARGAREGEEAGASARAEGFSPGTIVFLDIEEGGRLPETYHAYLAAWSEALVRAGFRPGAYCSNMPVREDRNRNITTVRDIREHAATRDFVIWAYNDACPPSPGCAFPHDPPYPVKSGSPDAAVWQFAQSPRRKEFTKRCAAKYAADGNCYAPGDAQHAWFLDVNSSTSPDPSGGAQ